jgi:hypothetical protein
MLKVMNEGKHKFADILEVELQSISLCVKATCKDVDEIDSLTHRTGIESGKGQIN